MKLMNSSLFQKKPIIVTIIFLLVTSIGLIALNTYSNYDIAKFDTIREREQNSLDEANATYELIQKADISLRDYMLTGNISYRKALDADYPQLNTDIVNLSKSKNFEVNTYTNDLIRLSSYKERQLKNTVNIFSSSGLNVAIASLPASESLSQNITKLISKIQTERDKAMLNYQQRAAFYRTVVDIVGPLIILADIFLIGIATYQTIKQEIKAKSLNDMQTNFVSIASHQLRTPATVIKQNVYFLLNGFYGKLTKKQKSVLLTIDNSNNRSISIANGLLYLAHIDASNHDILKQKCDLSFIIRNSLGNYEAAIKDKNIKLNLSLPLKPTPIMADEKYLQLLFEILIENAVQYSQNHKIIQIKLRSDPNYYHIEFKDQGIGIAKKDQTRIFERFLRLENGIKMRPDGSGIGLYLASNIVKMHGGKIDLKSSLGSGSTFSIQLEK